MDRHRCWGRNAEVKYVKVIIGSLIAIFLALAHVPQASLFADSVIYTYDDLNRLIYVDSGNNRVEYIYDEVGNRLRKRSSPIVLTTAYPAGGSFNTSQTVTLSCANAGSSVCSTIYYTLDGSTPTTSSSVYSGPLSISSPTTLKYFAVDSAGNKEAVKIQIYLIDRTTPLTQLTGTNTSVILTCIDGGSGCYRIYYTTDGSTPTTASAVYTGPINVANAQVVKYFSVDMSGNKEPVKTFRRQTLISAGGEHTVVLKTDGTLWSWGYNKDGQLGESTQLLSRSVPGMIGADTDWAAVSAGDSNTFALKSDGGLWAWGHNWTGQSGNVTTAAWSAPVRIGADTDWAAVAAGYMSTYALKTDGSLWAWGSNLGDGTTVVRTTPARIGADNDWATVAAGNFHALAVKTDGSLWVWGSNNHGQLGDGTTDHKYVPVRIGTDTNWVAVAAGDSCSLALKSDGSLWAWGENNYGQLGDGTTVDKSMPVRIGSDVNWAAISLTNWHTVALKTDGSLWTWGLNNVGQLGDGTLVDKSLPIRLGSDTDWVAISAGYGHTAALKTDGSLWTWGLNDVGQLGDGTMVNKSVPTKVLNFSPIPSCPSGTSYNPSTNQCNVVSGNSYQCPYNNNTYVALNDCTSACVQTAACTVGPGVSVTFSGTSNVYDQVFAFGSYNTIGGYGSQITISGATLSGQVTSYDYNSQNETGNIYGSGNTITGDAGGAITVTGATVSGSLVTCYDYGNYDCVLTGSGNTITSDCGGMLSFMGNTVNVCPLSGGSACDVNNQCAKSYSCVPVSGCPAGYSLIGGICTASDTTAPVTMANPAGGTYGASQTVTLSCSDTGGSGCAGTYYTLDGNTPTKSSSIYNGLLSITSSVTLKYFSVDKAGNSEAVKSQAYVIDSIAPMTTATPAGGAYSVSQTVTLICSDTGGSGCGRTYYTLDGSTPTTSSSSYSGPLSIASSVILKYFSVDQAGNSEAVNSQSYVIDAIAPVTTATPVGGTYSGSRSVTLICSDTGGSGCSRTYYTLDGSMPTTSSSIYSGLLSITSSVTFRYFSVDQAGNSEAVKSQLYVIDSIAPVTTATPTGGSFYAPQIVTFSCSDTGGSLCSRTYYTLDGSTPTMSSRVYSGPLSITASMTLKYFSVDVAGNSEAVKSQSYVISSDITPPVTTASPVGGSYNAPQLVTLSCSDTGGSGCARTYYTLDGNIMNMTNVYSSPLNITSSMTLKYFSVDQSGNSERLSFKSQSYVIDVIAPVTTATPVGGIYNRSQLVSLSCSDSGGSGCSRTYYTLNGSTPTTSSSVYGGPLNVASNMTIKYFSVDGAGNREAVKSQSYVIDMIAPVTTATPVGGTYNTSQTVTLSCSDTGGSGCSATYYTLGNASYSSVYIGPLTITSSVTLRYFSVDRAGNFEAVKSQSYVIASGDVTAPVTTATPSGGTYSGTQMVTLTCSDTGGSGCSATYYVLGDSATSGPKLYSGPVPISSGILRYYSVDRAGNTESLKSQSYVITSP